MSDGSAAFHALEDVVRKETEWMMDKLFAVHVCVDHGDAKAAGAHLVKAYEHQKKASDAFGQLCDLISASIDA